MNPEPGGQAHAVRQAWRAAGLDPAEPGSVGLLEAHGTATPAGDSAELATLADVFGPGDGDAVLGSVKSMIGHAMPAAGVAGLVKAALAVHHRTLLPTLHCDDPHPALARTRFRTLEKAADWETTARSPVRRAAVNAFGFGGINAHVVLEEAPDGHGSRASAPARPVVEVDEPEHVLLLAAESPAHLAALLDADDDTVRAAGLAPGHPHPEAGPARLGIVGPTAKRLALARRAVGLQRGWHGRGDVWFRPGPPGCLPRPTGIPVPGPGGRVHPAGRRRGRPFRSACPRSRRRPDRRRGPARFRRGRRRPPPRRGAAPQRDRAGRGRRTQRRRVDGHGRGRAVFRGRGRRVHGRLRPRLGDCPRSRLRRDRHQRRARSGRPARRGREPGGPGPLPRQRARSVDGVRSAGGGGGLRTGASRAGRPQPGPAVPIGLPHADAAPPCRTDGGGRPPLPAASAAHPALVGHDRRTVPRGRDGDPGSLRPASAGTRTVPPADRGPERGRSPGVRPGRPRSARLPGERHPGRSRPPGGRRQLAPPHRPRPVAPGGHRAVDGGFGGGALPATRRDGDHISTAAGTTGLERRSGVPLAPTAPRAAGRAAGARAGAGPGKPVAAGLPRRELPGGRRTERPAERDRGHGRRPHVREDGDACATRPPGRGTPPSTSRPTPCPTFWTTASSPNGPAGPKSPTGGRSSRPRRSCSTSWTPRRRRSPAGCRSPCTARGSTSGSPPPRQSTCP